MRGFADLKHPVVEAIAEDSISGRKSMTTVKWTHLNKVEGKYRVQLNTAGGLLLSMANANSLAVIPEGTEIGIGDKVSVWPLDWSQCP
jgi:molybdopterin molybdotransferase